MDRATKALLPPPAPAVSEAATGTALAPSRSHLTRLMALWRSAGWPCRDALEIDLLAAGWVQPHTEADGRECLHLTPSGLQLLATARQRQRHAVSAHDQLAQRVARQLRQDGRLVWLELSLRAKVQAGNGTQPSPGAPLPHTHAAAGPTTPELLQPSLCLGPVAEPTPSGSGPAAVWRLARPDVFSVRNTSVAAYLHPVVHEIKVSRADLLSDLRHAAKREAYQWLCNECYYVFPAGLAAPNEIPEAFGIWVMHGPIETGRLELVRAARHAPCELPFAVWMALAKATPLQSEWDEQPQPLLGTGGEPMGSGDEPALRRA